MEIHSPVTDSAGSQTDRRVPVGGRPSGPRPPDARGTAGPDCQEVVG